MKTGAGQANVVVKRGRFRGVALLVCGAAIQVFFVVGAVVSTLERNAFLACCRASFSSRLATTDNTRLLAETSTRFDVMGISLGGWRRLQNFSKLITQKCHAGTKARFLLMHEANPVLKEVVHPIDSAESYESLLADIGQSRVFYERLSRDTPNLHWRHISRGGCPDSC